jgi:hypothetical protein
MRSLKSFFILLLIPFIFISCTQLTEYQALKDGYYVNEYALDLIQSKKMQLSSMPYLIPEFQFKKDTVRFFAGYDKMTATYTKKGNTYTLKDIHDQTQYTLILTSDSTFVLHHNFHNGDEPSFNATENKKTYTFKKSPYDFNQCLNQIALAGTYEIIFPAELAGKKVRFKRDGSIENFDHFKKYSIPYSGDAAQMLSTTSRKNSIYLESNAGTALYAWKYDRNQKDHIFYSTTPPVPAIKGDQKIIQKVFQLKKIN